MQCTACAAPAPDGAKFCPSCGSALVAVPAGLEERRVVTIVFCDLVGSTTLSGQLDPEVLRTVTLRYFELMRTSLQAHGGTVEKFIGDAVMAVFGVPAMHEDDARRALAATLDMSAALAVFNLELTTSLGIRLDVRIGVNTGEVIATADPAAGQVLVSGEVVNVAARLEQHAEAGQILLGEQTVRAAGAAAIVESTGPLLLKGKAEPVLGYRLLGLQADDPELLRRFDLPFIGREQELAELNLVLDRVARQRSCHLVNLYGEAGIGKTRLIRTWRQHLDPATVRLGSGRCRPYGDTGTLIALADAVEQLLAEAGAEPLPAGALDVLASGLLRDGTPNPSVSETVTALAVVLTELARRTSVVLVIDDCQWAPSVLLDVLDELAEYLDHEAVLLLCAARPDLLDHRPGWGSGRLNANSLVLQGLSGDDSALLATEFVEVSAHDSQTCERILERAEGNPLHLEQLFAALTSDGSRGPLPPTVYALLAARIDALDPSARLLLDLAAIIGREFDATGLRALTDTAEDCTPTLRELSRRRLIEPLRGRTGTRHYRFSSGLIQEVAYKGMAKRVRSERHERFARCLQAADGATAEVAGHLERAYRYRAELGVTDASCETLRTSAASQLGVAGATALSHADLCWAQDLLSRAVALLRPDEPSWPPIAQRLAEVQLALGRRDEALLLLPVVLETAIRSQDQPTAAHARLQLATHDPAGGYGSAAAVARASLPVFQARGDQLGLARAKVRIAQELQFQGRHGEAEALLLDAVARAVQADAQPERAMALGALGVSLWRGPTPAEPAIERCTALLAEHGPNRGTVRVTLNCPLAVLLALRERTAEAQACLQVAGSVARSLGYAEAEVFIPLFSATVAGLAGQPGEAESLLRSALGACERLGEVGLVAAVARDLARNLLDRGVWDEAQALTGSMIESVAPLAPSEAADQLGVRARIEALRGNPALAAELAGRAAVEAARTDSPVSRGIAELDRAQVLRAQRQFVAGRQAAVAAGGWFEHKGHLVGIRQAGELAELIAAEGAAG